MKIWFVGLIFASPLLNAEIWIKDTKSSWFEFQSHLISLDSKPISYGEHLLKSKREEANHFPLKDLLLKAQEHYLSGEITLALKGFQKITSLSLLADWNEEQRKTILYAFLRRAQNETNLHKKQALLISASQFILDAITTDYLDYSLFPPPLLEQLKEIQKQQILVSLPLKQLFSHYEIVLINGKRISLEQKNIKIPSASYRVTALSSSHKSWTKIIPISYLLTQNIKTHSLTTGYCKNIKLKQNNNDMKIFYNKDCHKKHLKDLKMPATLLDHSLNTFKHHSSKTNAAFSFVKTHKTWFLIGSTVITTSLMLWFVNHQKKPPQSSLLF